MKNCKKAFVIIIFPTMQVVCFLLFHSNLWASSLLEIIDLKESAPQPLEVLLQSLNLQDIEIQLWKHKKDAAKDMNGDAIHSIGVSYEQKDTKPETLIDLYKHAIIRGSHRAWYSLGQCYHARREGGKAGSCFLHLAKLNIDLFLHLEEKYGGWQHTYSVACKLWSENNPLCVRLLEKVYEFYPKRRKEAAHYLAKAYTIKRHDFPYAPEKVEYWLKISAELGNVEDDYLLCALDYIQQTKNKKSLELHHINRVRSLVRTSAVEVKFGIEPNFFLTRLLVEFGSTQGENGLIQEAFQWLLKALESTDKRTRSLIWTTKDGIARNFSEMENHRELSITSAPNQSTRHRNLYEMAFYYLQASNAQGTTMLKKAGESFLQSYELVPNLPSRFYATLIQYYLTLYNPSQSIIMHGNLRSLDPPHLPNVSPQHINAIITRANQGNAEDLNRLGFLYLTGYSAETSRVSQDRSFAEMLLREAASKGCEEAMLNLANGYMKGWFGKVDPLQAAHWYDKASALFNALKLYQALINDVLMKGDANLIRKLISNFPVSKFKGHASLMALFYRSGLYAISPSIEHEIFFLKVAAEAEDIMAKRVLARNYPLAVPLNTLQRELLTKSRTYLKDKPRITIIGGGISGVLTSILLAKLSKEGKISVGEICLIEQNSVLFKGASELPSRLHLGGEYPKDQTTAYQCLFGAALFRQMFQTERALTPIMFNDFLLSLESLKSSQTDSRLSEEGLINHYQRLNEAYAEYLQQLKDKGSLGVVEKLLFGSLPLFHKIEGKDWEELGVSHHFSLGLRTKERGVQAVGLGVILEHLLTLYNVRVKYNCRVEDIQLLSGGGFAVKSDNHSPIYARYIINAAWDNNSYLEWLIKKQSPPNTSLAQHDPPRPVKHVFLRSLALIDTTHARFPGNSSFFGLIGGAGGMVSCFNRSFATIFIPQNGLSYQGQYDLSPAENYPHTLPYQAVDKRDSLKDENPQKILSNRILEDAQNKYPYLKGSKALGVITHTTLSDNDEAYKRTHSDAYWVAGTDALQVCAQKLTFAPFVSSQVVARLIFDSPVDFRPNFNAPERTYLEQFKAGKTVADPREPICNVCLPDSFTLIDDDNFMTSTEFLEKMHLYAFHRLLPFTIFDESTPAREAGRDLPKQLNLIVQNPRIKDLDLSHHPLTSPTFDMLINFLRHNKVLTTVKLGQLEEINDDDEDEVGGTILSCLSEIPTLQEVTLRSWNLSFSRRYKPLAVLIARLQSIHFEDGTTLTARGIKHIIDRASPIPSLTRFSFKNGTFTKQSLGELFTLTAQLPNLRYLNFKGNNIGSHLKGDMKSLANLISTLSHLEKVDLSRNQLFSSFQSEIDAPNKLPLSLEAHPLLSSISTHPKLKEIYLNDNGPASSILQDRIDYWLARTTPL